MGIDDGEGLIAVGDVGKVLDQLGIQLTAEQLGEAAKQLDTAGTGTIGLEDFAAWMQG